MKHFFITLLFTGLVLSILFSQITTFPFEENFEGSTFPPPGWTTNDLDGDGHNWLLWNAEAKATWIGQGLFLGYYSSPGGVQAAFSQSVILPFANGGVNLPLNPNNYLISPAISLPLGYSAALTYYSWTLDHPTETYSVMVSTTNTNPTSFITLETVTPSSINPTSKQIDLSFYAGQTVYLAFRHHNSTNSLGIVIDAVKVSTTLIQTHDLAALAITGPQPNWVTLNQPINYTVRIQNLGSQAVTSSDYSVRLMQGTTILQTLNGANLNYNATSIFDFSWTPAATGMYEVFGEVVYTADTVLENNKTQSLQTHILAVGTEINRLGDPNTANFSVWPPPFHFSWNSSISQSIYLENEITSRGEITHLTFTFQGAGNIPGPRPVKIFMAALDPSKTSFDSNSDWVPYQQLTLVYEGEFPVHINRTDEIVLILNPPFSYNGGNLLVMTQRVLYPETTIYTSNSFLVNSVGTGNNRALVRSSDTAAYGPTDNWNTPTSGDGYGGLQTWVPNIRLFFNTAGLGALEGSIVHNGTSLEGVKITLADTGRNVLTNAQGNYQFDNIYPGLVTVSAAKYTYKTEYSDVEIIGGETAVQNFILNLATADLVALTFSGTQWPTAEYNNPYHLQVQNATIYNALGVNYTITLKQELENNDDLVLTTVQGINLAADATHDFILHFVPLVASVEQQIKLYAEINYTLDENPYNNRSDPITVLVMPPGVSYTYIGNPLSTTISQANPVNLGWESSVSQAIYRAEEIQVNGLITHLTYWITPGGVMADNRVVEFYMATTNMNAFPHTDAWVPFDQFQLVYQGPINIPPSSEMVSVHIELNEPYNYVGGNLVMMGFTPRDIRTAGGNNWQLTNFPSQNRSIWNFGNAIDFDLSNLPTGTFTTGINNIALTIQVGDFGSLIGTVTSEGSPVAGAMIQVNGTNRRGYSQANGNFEIPNLLVGFYSATVICHGYTTSLVSNFEIQAGQSTTENIELVKQPTVLVSGLVIASDTQAGLPEAVVMLAGYENYQAITNAQGEFILPSVYSEHVYTLTIAKEKYIRYTNTAFEVSGTTDILLDQIIIMERTNPPEKVFADVSGSSMQITWDPPREGLETWITHSNENPSHWGVGTASRLHFVAAHRFTPEQLYVLGVAGADLVSVSFYVIDLLISAEIRIYQGGGDQPLHSGALVYSQPIDLSDIISNDWTNIPLHNVIQIPSTEEFWIGVYYEMMGTTPAGYDSGPMVYGYGDLIYYNNSWVSVNDLIPGTNANWLIKGFVAGADDPITLRIAQGQDEQLIKQSISSTPRSQINYREIEENSASPLMVRKSTKIKDHEFTTSLIKRDKKSVPISRDQVLIRLLESYTIYRANIDQLNQEDTWVLLANNITTLSYTDHGWSNVGTGAYKYVVQAEYSHNYYSLPAFSNTVSMGMTSQVTINVTTDDGGEIEGAKVRLINNSGDLDHVYEEIAASNTIIFPAVWFGNYSLSLSKMGYMTYQQPNLDIMSDPFQHSLNLPIDYALINESFEGVFPPEGWRIIDSDSDGFTWRRVNQPGHPTNTGAYAIMSDSYIAGNALYPDNWLITPPLPLRGGADAEALLKWYVAAQDPRYFAEKYSVLISTNPDLASFMSVFSETLQNTDWQERSLDLSFLAGQTIYIAFRHHDISNQYQIKLDDIQVISINTTGKTDSPVIPLKTVLKSNYPNPFNPSTTISFDMAKGDLVQIDIYNIRGQNITTLFNGYLEAGTHQVVWKGTDNHGKTVGSGIYLYQAKIGSFLETKRMVLMK